jgi:hypothetical protein
MPLENDSVDNIWIVFLYSGSILATLALCGLEQLHVHLVHHRELRSPDLIGYLIDAFDWGTLANITDGIWKVSPAN